MKKFQKNNLTIALMFCMLKMKILSCLHKSNCEKQVILLMIPNREERHYHYQKSDKASFIIHAVLECHHIVI